ncbi:uncharacterized protein LOC132735141 [Ruditapes philippinarum]|uniref:uncharacterized protein LOC132735141 n=1 Tax=Ruditapes philippinarum TaxID=129788 RepID=UPI00295AC1D3|nr:uncharacterized protein LOC132735141 [Ruditapes philippinarum]
MSEKYPLDRCFEMKTVDDWNSIDPNETDLVLFTEPFAEQQNESRLHRIFQSMLDSCKMPSKEFRIDIVIVSENLKVNQWKENHDDNEIFKNVIELFMPTDENNPLNLEKRNFLAILRPVTEQVRLGKVSVITLTNLQAKYKYNTSFVEAWLNKFDIIYAAVIKGLLNVIVTCESSFFEKVVENYTTHALLNHIIQLQDKAFVNVAVKEEPVSSTPENPSFSNTGAPAEKVLKTVDVRVNKLRVTAQPSMIDQKELNMMWKRTDKNKHEIYEECERISKFIENMSSSIVHVWPAYDTNANDDIVFVVITTKDIDDDLQVKDKLEKTGYNVFVTRVDSCSKESEQVLQKVDQLETNQCFSKLEDLGSVINKHSDRLLRNHQYLSAISGSNVRSERFSLGQSEHFVSFQSCIVLYVIAKGKIPLHENKFEDNLDGIPVDVREGIFQRTILPSERYSKPVKMGCQITSNRTQSFGTLGGFFYHEDFGLCGVTCAHVVLDEAMIHDLRGEKKVWSREESPMVFHPNTTQDEYKLGPVKEAVYRTGSEDSSGIDIAVFKIEGATPDSGFFPEEPEMCFETGRTLGTSDLKKKTPVFKYGRTTALTRGYIEFENTTVRMIKFERKYTLGSNEYTFLLKNQIEVRPESSLCTQLFNDFGDSGAFVFVKDSDNQLVCIGICVGKLNTNGVVIPITAVKGDLGITKFCDFRLNRLCEKIKEMDKKLDTILVRLPSNSMQ